MNKTKIFKQLPMSKLKQQGFTIIEFLIASTLSLLVVLAVGAGYIVTASMNQSAEERLSIQQEIRMANSMITRDAHMAGSFGCASMDDRVSRSNNTNKSVNIHNGVRGKDNFAADRLIRASGQNQKFNPAPHANSTYSQKALEFNHSGAVMLNRAEVERIAPGFVLNSGGVGLLFQYGTNPAVLETLVVDSKTDPTQIGIGAGTEFNAAGSGLSRLRNTVSKGGYVALASCNRVDVFKGGMLTVNANDKISINGINSDNGLWVGVQPEESKDTLANAKLDYHSANSMELMRYIVNVYAVGTFNTQLGLYRISLADDGNWSTPQLLSANVTDMLAWFGFPAAIQKCYNGDTDVENAAGASFIFGDNFFDNLNQLGPPSSLLMRLTVLGKENAQADGTTRTSTYDVTATIRGGNICANRNLKD